MIDPMKITSSASAKAILFGEHAVVYGEPAIAIPLLKVRTYAEFQPNGDEFRIVSDKTELNNTYDELTQGSGIRELLSLLKEKLSLTEFPKETLTIHSDIPIASGLGSGAALSVAVIRAFSGYYHRSFTIDEVNNIAYEIEKIYHGSPSGIDNTTVAYEQAVIFSKSSGFQPLEADLERVPFLIVDTSIRSRTIDVVSDVKKNIDRNMVYIKEIGELVRQAKKALCDGNNAEIGTLMNENQKLLCQIDVSCPELDHLITLGLDNGALGGKLTGAGRGGNFILLARDEDHAEHLKNMYLNLGLKVVL